MNKIGYAKYSYNRDVRFQTKTVINEHDGIIHVTKSALNACGSAHIHNIESIYKELNSFYKGTNIKVARCELKDDQTIEFQYIKGKSVENMLDEFLGEGKIDKMIELMRDYFDSIGCNVCITDFKKSRAFEKVFPNIIIEKETKCLKYANLDAIFSNAKIGEDVYTLIDYEWCIDACVPLNYIIYRCIFWYAGRGNRADKIEISELLKLFNITDSELKLYEQMEDAFQAYVLGSYIPEWIVKKGLSAEEYRIDDFEMLKDSVQVQLQIYEDVGNGFIEEESFFVRASKGLDRKYFFDTTIKLHNETDLVRIDPSIHNCILIIEDLSFQSQKSKQIKYDHNGIELQKKMIVFVKNDPKIVFKVGDYKSIHISGWVIPISENVSREFVKHNKGIQKKVKTIADLAATIQEYQKNVNGLVEHISKLNENSNELHERLGSLERKFSRIVESKYFKLISWHFDDDEKQI